MKCAKCGRESAEDQAFCRTCLQEMEKYPVKPGTVVNIPRRTEDTDAWKQQSRKKQLPTAEAQLRRLKKRVRALRAALLTALLLIGVLAYAMTRMVDELDVQRLLGQNYSTVETQGEQPGTSRRSR